MTAAELSIFATSAGLLLFMPGPTNAVMMASGAASGLWRSLPLTLVAVAGYLGAITPLIALAELVGAHSGELAVLLKLIAAVVMTLVAIKLWVNAVPDATAPRKPGKVDVFALTLFNPKALVISFGMIQPVAGLVDLASKCAILGALIILSAGCWIVAGAGTRKMPTISSQWITRTTSVILSCFAIYFLTVAIGEIDFQFSADALILN